MSDWPSQRRRKSVFGDDKTAVCFYTGETIVVGSTATVEHLVSTKCVPNSRWNLVPAHKWINAQIGDAPLKVKFHLKSELAKLTMFPGMTSNAW